jgi:hypothetical protein
MTGREGESEGKDKGRDREGRKQAIEGRKETRQQIK